MRIYVAGPYSPKNHGRSNGSPNLCIREAQRNVDRAISIGLSLIRKGHFPFIPHLTHYVHQHHEADFREDICYEWDNTFLDNWAEALFYISSSFGADKELERARKLGLKIFKDLDEVPINNELKLL